MSIFGDIRDGSHVERAVIDFLKRWEQTYLAEIERNYDEEAQSLPTIRSWVTAKEFDHWPEDQLPTCLVICPGLADPPKPKGDGSIWARWVIGIAVIASADTKVNTQKLAKMYTSAFRTAMVQHRSLDGFAEGLSWQDERYTDLPTDTDRTMGAGQAIFFIDVSEVSNSKAGPKIPLVPPYEEPAGWPTVQSADTTIKWKDEE